VLLGVGTLGVSCSVRNLDAILVPSGGASGSLSATPDAAEMPDAPSGTASGSICATLDAAETTESGAPTDTASPYPGRKRGIAYGYNRQLDIINLSPGVGWWMNWTAHPDDSLHLTDYKTFYSVYGVEYVPMLWGNTGPASIASQVPAGARYLLTFNDPNFGSQSNVTPAEAAAAWPAIVSFAKARGLQLVSPGVEYCPSNLCSTKPGNVADPILWLNAFLAACSPACQFDFTGMSSRQCTKTDLSNELTKFEAFGKPIWITQFSCRPTVDGSEPDATLERQFLGDVVPMLEADAHVFRYAWFTGRPTNPDAGSDPYDLLDPIASGGLTMLGADYVNQPSP